MVSHSGSTAKTILQPASIHWCDGSEEEAEALTEIMVKQGTLIPLDETKRPNSFLARSDPGDVARVEDRTFICCENEIDAGPTNNWRDPAEMRDTLNGLFQYPSTSATLRIHPYPIRLAFHFV